MKRAMITAVLAVVPLLAAPALSQTSPLPTPGDAVIATVDGTEIRASDVVALYQSLPERYRQIGMAQIADQIVERLIDQTLTANAAREAGLEKDPEVQRRVQQLTDGVLQQVYLDKRIGEELTEAKLKAAYKKRISEQSASEEIRARHILVKTEAEAQKIIQELGDDGDFAAAAKKHSTGPSGAKGGDLGFFADGMMVPEFSKAAFALKVGEVTKTPVKTQFGWHIIKLEERRKTEAPSYDTLIPDLRRELRQQAYQALMEKLRSTAKITRQTDAPTATQK